MEFTQTEQQKEKTILKSEDSLRDLFDNIKQNNILNLMVPEEEEEKEKARKIIRSHNG